MEKLIDTIIDLIEKNKYEEALTECSRFVFLNPLNPIGYELRGDCFLYFKKYQLAFINYREAISLTDPSSIKNKNNLSTLYKKKGICNLKTNNLINAIEDFTNSINYNPDNHEAFHLRSKAYRKTGNIEAALNDANTAINLFSQYAEAYNNRGCIYYLMKKSDEALDDFSKAISLKPEYGGAYYNRSLVYSNLKKDYDSAKKDLEKAELYQAQRNKPSEEKRKEKIEDINQQDKLKTYEEKREQFSNLTIENGKKLSEGLFGEVETKTNVIDFSQNEQKEKEATEETFSDVFINKEKEKPITKASEGKINNIIVEDVLEAKHKSETLTTPFKEEKEEKSLDDLVSEVKIPGELKTLHEEITQPQPRPQKQEHERNKEIECSKIPVTDKDKVEKTTVIKEGLKETEQKAISSTKKEKSPEKPPLKKYGQYFPAEPKKNYTTLYIIIGSILLLIILAAIFLVKYLKPEADKKQELTVSQEEKRNFVIYEKDDTNKITLKEEFKNTMLEKGLVLVVVNDGFKFQAGSFKDSTYAVTRAKWLITQEFEPEIETADLKEKGKYYRVRFGEFETVEEADSVAKTIK